MRRVSTTRADGSCDPLTELSGPNLRLQVTPALAAAGGQPERDTSIGTHTDIFTIPFVYGLGLVDAVPLETLRGMEDPQRIYFEKNWADFLAGDIYADGYRHE